MFQTTPGGPTSVDPIRRRLDQLKAELNHCRRQKEDETRALKEAREKLANSLEAIRLTKGVAEACQACANKQIESVVSRCLETVFDGEGLGFKIVLNKKRSKTEARLAFTVGDRILDEPLHDDAGGSVDLASFALRLS